LKYGANGTAFAAMISVIVLTPGKLLAAKTAHFSATF
jgi:hypothetical protein